MEMAKNFQEVDGLGDTRAGMEGEGHLAARSVMGMAFRAAKRSFDITASAVGMVVLSPLLLATAIAVKATSQEPVIFKRKRYGKDEVPFTCYKFNEGIGRYGSRLGWSEQVSRSRGARFGTNLVRIVRTGRWGALEPALLGA